MADQRYPRDFALASMLLEGLKSASKGLLEAGYISEAQAASARVLDLGRRMVAFDPANNAWLRALAHSTMTAASIDEEAGDLAGARRYSDQALALFEEAIKRDPESVNLRADMMGFRRRRALLAGRMPASESAAIRELDAGMALFDENSPSIDMDMLLYAVRLQLERWYWLSKLNSGQADSARQSAHQLASRISTAGYYPKFIDEIDANLAYADGNIADGDRRVQSLRDTATVQSLRDLARFRALACARAGKSCPRL